MIDIRTLEEKLVHKVLWEILTNSISYFSIIGLFIFFVLNEYNVPHQDAFILVLMGILLVFLLSLSSKNISLIIGNICLTICLILPLIEANKYQQDIIWIAGTTIFVYILLTTIYQILLKQRNKRLRGYLFIFMHILKATFIVVFYFLLKHFHICTSESIDLFNQAIAINCSHAYVLINLTVLIINFGYSIIDLFDQNSRLLVIAQEFKEVCSWSLDENVLANKVMQGNQGLTKEVRTVLFGDIRGFTQFTELYSQELVALVLQDFYEIVEEVAAKHSAYKPEFIADEFVTFFASPAKAVNCAIELRNQLTKSLAPYKLSLGMGLHEGPLLEGIIGGKTSKKYSVIGSTANIAARLQAIAEGGQILCSKKIIRNVQNIEFKEIKNVRLKGIKGYFKTFSITTQKPYFKENFSPIEKSFGFLQKIGKSFKSIYRP